MYSKKVLNFYIKEKLHQKDSNNRQLAQAIGITQSNLSRALESEQHNLTLPQFADLVEYLSLDPDQVYHILTGKRKKEAAVSLVAASAKRLVEELTK